MKGHKFADTETLQLLAYYCKRIATVVDACQNQFDTFMQDEDKIDVMSLNMIQLGERINSNLSDEFKEKYTEIPWRDYIAMRNKLTHAYFELDEELLWDSAITDVPILYEFCLSRLAEAGAEIPSSIRETGEARE